MACKYLISRPFYFSGCAQLSKIVHSSGVETEYFNAGGGVRLSPYQCCAVRLTLHFEIVHQPVNFITFKIYSYAGITKHPVWTHCLGRSATSLDRLTCIIFKSK